MTMLAHVARWLAPLLLLLDLWEKTVAQAKFHQQSKKVGLAGTFVFYDGGMNGRGGACVAVAGVGGGGGGHHLWQGLSHH